VLQLISLGVLFLVILRLPHKTVKTESRIKQSLALLKEFSIWRILSERIWPVMLSGVMITFIIASFWTIGGLYGLSLLGDTGSDWIILVMFGIPMMIGSAILSKLHIQNHKKKYIQVTLFLAGLSLISLFFFHQSLPLILVAIFSCGFFLSIAAPLNEAVYSDLLERSGKSKMHLLGIAKSNFSFAYIVAPLATGWLADVVGYAQTFVIVGIMAIVVSGFLFLATPTKLKLPQRRLAKLI
jgi:predicted MFS family arabinose efflux permease